MAAEGPIKITGAAESRAFLEQYQQSMSSDAILDVAARAVVNRIRNNFDKLERERPNKQGFPRQHFWSDARRRTQAPKRIGAKRVLIEVDKPGVLLRLLGGTVVPVHAKALTIPATPEAYGRRAGEISGLKLKWAMNEKGKMMPALVQEEGRQAQLKGQKNPIAARAKTVFYWLVSKTVHKADPTVMPTDDEMTRAANDAVRILMERGAR